MRCDSVATSERVSEGSDGDRELRVLAHETALHPIRFQFSESLAYISMPYHFEASSNTASHSFQADKTQPTPSAVLSPTSQRTVAQLLANIPTSRGSITPSIGEHQGNIFSIKRKCRSKHDVVKRIEAYLQTIPGDGSA
jgi:hypothetical protein